MTSELAPEAGWTIDGLVKESLEKIMFRQGRPIAITARFFSKVGFFGPKLRKKPELDQ